VFVVLAAANVGVIVVVDEAVSDESTMLKAFPKALVDKSAKSVALDLASLKAIFRACFRASVLFYLSNVKPLN